MKIYKTSKGIIIDRDSDLFLLTESSWDTFINRRDLFKQISIDLNDVKPHSSLAQVISSDCLAPIGDQEVWAAGVTYIRSRQARMEEAKDAGGGDFYARVYEAERPELFFKAPAHRVVGHGKQVRIRKDS